MHCFLKSLIVLRIYHHFTYGAANHCVSPLLANYECVGPRRYQVKDKLSFWGLLFFFDIVMLSWMFDVVVHQPNL